jgi:serine protease Do
MRNGDVMKMGDFVNWNRFFLFMIGVSTLTVGLPCDQAFADAETYRKTLTSTAWVLSKNDEGTSSGTGVLIDSDRKLLITNAHVVGDSRSAVVFFPELKNDRPLVERTHYLEGVKTLGVRGTVVAVDRQRDLALIQLSRIPEGISAVKLAAESCTPGEQVESIGNPGTSDALWVYSSGTVRAVYEKQFRTGAGDHEFQVVETQTPLNTGDSGGPVVNHEGELVAIAQAISPKARLVSYNVDVSEVKKFLASPWKPAPLPIKEVLDVAELTYSQHASGHFQIDIPVEVKLSGDATTKNQAVFVTKEFESYERADIRKIWSLAATSKSAFDLETTTRLLTLSAQTKLGGWTIEEGEGGEFLLLYVVKMDATATADALKSTCVYVAKVAEAMNREWETKSNPKAQDATEVLNQWLGE